jgi:CelD/BcsL family acetyltransferase involved in cellulose biosynthesis/GNAT superfamily N-acetyltransferase
MDAVAVRADLGVPAAANVLQPVTSHSVRSLAALEAALASGLHEEWRGVVDADPLASLFQTSGWCMPWYRAYADAFDPCVIVVSAGGRTVGLVPMAVNRATRELVFASHTMADYRDIIALPGYREQVVAELMRHYLEGNFAKMLQVGWIDPASDTPALIAKICAQRGLRHTVRYQPCWRWFPPAPSKPSAQKFLNWYKRNGTVSFDVVESEPAWARFREEYYRQHTLRQIQAGRQTAFDDTRKAALYEELFHSNDIQSHVTAFCLNGRMLAGHFGYVWRGVLLLGPPSIRLEDEQRSPAVILLSWIIQNAESLGLKGFDLTIGESDFKKRLGNQCVQLRMVEVHASTPGYYAQTARDGLVAATKRTVERVAGPDAWKTRVKPAAESLSFERERIAELGVSGTIRAGFSAAAQWVYDPGIERTYALTSDSIGAAAAPATASCLRENCIEDLLLWRGASPTTARAMTACARSYARLRNTGHTLHTLVVNDALAGWCYSSADEIHDVFVLPEFRDGSAASLLRSTARSRLAGSARELRLVVRGGDGMLVSAAAAAGRLVAETRRPRLFGSSTLLDRASRLWRRLTWRAIKRRLALALRFEAEERTYRLSHLDAADLPASADFAKDRWEDLDLFVPTEPRHVREDVLADWRQRRARGEHVYTRVEDGRLAAYGWVVERQKTMRLDWVKQAVDLPDHSAVIYDFYTLPEYRHRDFYQRLLMHAMQDAARMPGIQWICLSILGSDQVPRWWVERIGMELSGSYFYSRVLWHQKKWQLTPTAGHSSA